MSEFDLSWFLTVPGMFISAGVLLLVVAIIVLIVSSSKGKKEKKKQAIAEQNNNNSNNNINNNAVAPGMDAVSQQQPVANGMGAINTVPQQDVGLQATPSVQAPQPVNPAVENLTVPPVMPVADPMVAPVAPVNPVVEPVMPAPQAVPQAVPMVEASNVYNQTVPASPMVETLPTVPTVPVVEAMPTTYQAPIVEPAPVVSAVPIVEPAPAAPVNPVAEAVPVAPVAPIVEPATFAPASEVMAAPVVEAIPMVQEVPTVPASTVNPVGYGTEAIPYAQPVVESVTPEFTTNTFAQPVATDVSTVAVNPVVQEVQTPQPVIYGGASPVVSDLNFGQNTAHQIYGGANPLENTQSMPIMGTPVAAPVGTMPAVNQMPGGQAEMQNVATPVMEPIVESVQ